MSFNFVSPANLTRFANNLKNYFASISHTHNYADHYVPSADQQASLTSSASSTGDYAINTEYSVVTGITLSRDGKGHVVGVSTTNQNIKDTNTTYSAMSQAEATTGTKTTARSISAKVLHTKIASMISSAEPTVQESVLASALSANTAFTVPEHTVGSKKMLVFFNGILCKQGSSEQYVDASATTITFNETLPAGSEITIYIV